MHGRNSRNKPSYIWSQYSPCCVGTFFYSLADMELGLVYGNRRVDNCRRNGRRFSIFD